MSEITFLASSKPFIIPDEIEDYYNHTVFNRMEDFVGLWVNEVDALGWGEYVEGLFTMPYIYEITGAGTKLFLLYLEKYMETGDVLELLYIPNQNDFEYYQKRLVEVPEPIFINIERLTYQDQYGTYQLKPKKWAEELGHKNYLTEFGVATIVKY